jgi:hypothetical protein
MLKKIGESQRKAKKVEDEIGEIAQITTPSKVNEGRLKSRKVGESQDWGRKSRRRTRGNQRMANLMKAKSRTLETPKKTAQDYAGAECRSSSKGFTSGQISAQFLKEASKRKQT